MNAPTVLDRKRFIGGSDAAAILGVSPWHTRLDLFLIKTGQKAEVTDPAREKLFRRGKRLEPIVVDMLIDEYGVKVTKRSTPEKPNRYADAAVPYLAAEIDFEWEATAADTERMGLNFSDAADLIGTIQNGEVKTVHPFASAKFGEEADEIPVEYAAQAMHGLMVTGRQVCMFAVMFGADNLLLYWIHRDDETIAGMRAQEIAFWNDHVLAGVHPEPVNLPDVLELFDRKTIAARITATPQIAELVPLLHQARDAAKAAVERTNEIRYEIGKFIVGEDNVSLDNDGKIVPGPDVKPGEHHLLFEGETILRLVKQTQSRLDGDAVKEKHPEIVPECSKQISFFKFSKPKKGKRK